MKKSADALGYYSVLGVYPEAEISEIKKQYYTMAKYWHPDHNENPQSLEMFQKVSVAYDILKDQKSRLIYDLLSCVYEQKNFPPQGSLKIYKNQANKDDKSLRVLQQVAVNGGMVQISKDICNIKEAGNMVLSTSINNWLRGWWGKNGYTQTCKAIKFNLSAVDVNNCDNIQLLVHNAVAYEQEENIEMAWIYAKQAEAMAVNDDYLLGKLRLFIEELNFKPTKKVKIPHWNSAELVRRQYMFPVFLGLCLVFCGLVLFSGRGLLSMHTENRGYYEERILGGKRVATDMVATKIVKTDSDALSKEHIIHLKSDCLIYNGPDKRYSVMKEGKDGQTVRVTGYTPDKKWYQIMIDNGEMGYVEKENTEKGFGNQVPFGSHVYRGNL